MGFYASLLSTDFSGERTTKNVKIRVISILLTIAMILALFLPTTYAETVSNSEKEATQLKSQIRQTYAAAQRATGRYSFNGWCGTLVSWQLYLMGIDSGVHGADGNMQYDLYASRDVTCGGYGVKRYPASQYTLKEALNAISRNGTVNAYNILVGFQRTNTAAGQIYGHAVVIHGIIDGMVYFMESYSTSLGGQYWPEGSAIVLPIDTFCDAYNRWTVFEGVVYFGVKTYAQLCVAHGANMTALVKSDVDALTEPVDEGINEARGTVEKLEMGQQVAVTGLYETPEGGLWYQLELEEGTGYVPVDAVIPLEDHAEKATVTSAQIPAYARKGMGLVLYGNVTSVSSDLSKVQVLVYGSEEDPVLQAQMEVSGVKTASLSDYRLDKDLTFRNLDVGTYRIVVLADVASNREENGQTVTETQTIKVWESQLRIVNDWKYYNKISFDGNGGIAEVQQWTLGAEETVKALPEATREGYRFVGWALDREGNSPVSPETLPQNSVTLYAQWEEEYDRTEDPINAMEGVWEECSVGAWYITENIRFLRLADGRWPTGWYSVDGERYFFNKAGAALVGWQTLYGGTYYFLPNGARATLWQEIDGVTYYFGQSGRARGGWLTFMDRQYYLTENGAVTTGWTTIDQTEYLFGEDGVLQMTMKGSAEDGYYVVYDRTAAEHAVSEDAKLLLG